jgi:hypothetical protein
MPIPVDIRPIKKTEDKVRRWTIEEDTDGGGYKVQSERVTVACDADGVCILSGEPKTTYTNIGSNHAIINQLHKLSDDHAKKERLVLESRKRR